MGSNINDKGSPPDETTAEMDVIKDLFGGRQPAASSVEVFSQDLFSEPAPAAAPAGAAYQAKPEEDIKVVTDDDLQDLFASSNIGRTVASAPPPAEPTPEPAAPEPAPVAQHVEAEELSLDSVAEVAPVAPAPAAPEPAAPAAEPAPAAAQHVEAEEITADFGSEPAAPAATATPVDAVDFKPEHVNGELGESVELPEVDHGTKSAILAGAAEIGQVAEEVAPPENPLDEISPDEIVADLEHTAQVGEMTAVAAGKKGELLEKTACLLQQLEPPGKDLLSAAELTKLHGNMNILIEWAKTMTERMDRLEAKLAKLAPEDDE